MMLERVIVLVMVLRSSNGWRRPRGLEGARQCLALREELLSMLQTSKRVMAEHATDANRANADSVRVADQLARGLHVRRESTGVVSRSRAILCRPVPKPYSFDSQPTSHGHAALDGVQQRTLRLQVSARLEDLGPRQRHMRAPLTARSTVHRRRLVLVVQAAAQLGEVLQHADEVHERTLRLVCFEHHHVGTLCHMPRPCTRDASAFRSPHRTGAFSGGIYLALGLLPWASAEASLGRNH
jgi:hypothetical protein